MKRLSIITIENIQRANEKLMSMSQAEIEEAVKNCPIYLTEKEINSAWEKACKQYEKMQSRGKDYK